MLLWAFLAATPRAKFNSFSSICTYLELLHSPVQVGAHKERFTEKEMVFQGFLAFLDPPKDSAKEALTLLFQKSVQVKVMTGDTLAVAVKVCRDVGIPTEHVVTGPELSLMENEEFIATVRQATILAKLTPIQKLNAIQVISFTILMFL